MCKGMFKFNEELSVPPPVIGFPFTINELPTLDFITTFYISDGNNFREVNRIGGSSSTIALPNGNCFADCWFDCRRGNWLFSCT